MLKSTNLKKCLRPSMHGIGVVQCFVAPGLLSQCQVFKKIRKNSSTFQFLAKHTISLSVSPNILNHSPSFINFASRRKVNHRRIGLLVCTEKEFGIPQKPPCQTPMFKILRKMVQDVGRFLHMLLSVCWLNKKCSAKCERPPLVMVKVFPVMSSIAEPGTWLGLKSCLHAEGPTVWFKKKKRFV